MASFGLISAQTKLHTAQSLRDPNTLVSSTAIFKLGFFSPTNSTNRYIGIWYNVSESDGKLEVVWVANRNNPLNDSSGVLQISEDGNLQIVNGQKMVLWSSDVAAYKADDAVAQLQDTGNLVLLSNSTGMIIWQSFDHPTDTFLPGMEFTIDGTLTNKQILAWSWKNPSDPSPGNTTVGLTTHPPPELFLWDDGRPNWRSGPWNGNVFIGHDSLIVSLVADDVGQVYVGFSQANQTEMLHFVLTYDGAMVKRKWDSGSRRWITKWNSQQSPCDFYGKCGAFGSCNLTNSPICTCLKGFVPKNDTEWNKGNWTSGCVRRTPLQCGIVGSKENVFWSTKPVKVPDNEVWLSINTEDECSSWCQSECSCVAYAYYLSIGCMIWNTSLIDIDEFSNNIGIDLFVRLAHSELDLQEQVHQGSDIKRKSTKWKVITVIMVLVGVVMFGVCIWLCLCRRNGMSRSPKKPRQRKYMIKDDDDDIGMGDLPMFEFEQLLNATNSFHDRNKLGRGGFGTVYKGNLEDGKDVAVKRLSKVSGQGLREFMTEVVVISKLQHRNLVRLLGCCVEGEEKLLVYEFLPNNSLDALLFDPHCGDSLDWKTRFNIIQGICRGLLYLHRDSRLRIIHRDLKASNILLDDKLNPKISDFGMAKIFGENEDLADSKTVVGTYGYMSPEYAMEGRFSEKSDVFSFGVLLLEIVTGRRNTSFKDEESLSLLAHAWKIWNEDDIASLIDPSLSESTIEADEILRCIQVALLCVQELPEDRPNISMIISMIDGEASNLPSPKQPGFTLRRNAFHKDEDVYGSVNRVSLSYISGR